MEYHKPAASGKKKQVKTESFIQKDEKTGEPYLKFPMPQPETIQKFADILSAFAGKK